MTSLVTTFVNHTGNATFHTYADVVQRYGIIICRCNEILTNFLPLSCYASEWERNHKQQYISEHCQKVTEDGMTVSSCGNITDMLSMIYSVALHKPVSAVVG